MSWQKQIIKAEKELARSSAQIKESRAGIPSGKNSAWRVSSSPSSYKEKR